MAQAVYLDEEQERLEQERLAREQGQNVNLDTVEESLPPQTEVSQQTAPAQAPMPQPNPPLSATTPTQDQSPPASADDFMRSLSQSKGFKQADQLDVSPEQLQNAQSASRATSRDRFSDIISKGSRYNTYDVTAGRDPMEGLKTLRDEQAARPGAELKQNQETADKLRSNEVFKTKTPMDLWKESTAARLQASKTKVAEGTEQDQITQEAQRTQKGALDVESLQQKLDFASKEQPEKLKQLKAKTQVDLINVKRLGKMDRTLTPTLASEFSKILKISPEDASKLTYEDADYLMKNKVGGLGASSRSSSGTGMSKAMEALDKDYIKYYNQWTQSGAPQAAMNIGLVADTEKTLENAIKSGERLSGWGQELIPDRLQQRKALEVQQDIRRAVMSSLRETLGAQFTEKEGALVFGLAYDIDLPMEMNLKKVRRLRKQLEGIARNNEAKAKHFTKEETLRGFQPESRSYDFHDLLKQGEETKDYKAITQILEHELNKDDSPSSEGSQTKPKKRTQNGITYILNEETGEYE